MKHKNSFEVQFSELNKDDKVQYAKAFLKGIENAHSDIKDTVSRVFNKVVNNKSLSLNEHMKEEIKLKRFQEMDKNITKSKAKNLRDFYYVDMDDLTILTPRMEEGIKAFVNDYIENKFNVIHDIAGFDVAFSKAIYQSHEKITDSYEPYKKYLDKLHDEGQEELKDKYSDLFPNHFSFHKKSGLKR